MGTIFYIDKSIKKSSGSILFSSLLSQPQETSQEAIRQELPGLTVSTPERNFPFRMVGVGTPTGKAEMLDDASFKKVLESVVQVSIQTPKQSCERTQEGLLFLLKNSFAGIAIKRLLYPDPISDFKTIAPELMLNDFPTIYVILRTMFEAYINMHYVLIEPDSDEEKSYRFYRWKRHGYSEILEVGKSLGVDDRRLDETRRLKLEGEDKIKSSTVYLGLSDQEKQSVMDSTKWITKLECQKWTAQFNAAHPENTLRPERTIMLGIRSGFHLSQIKFFFKFLSNYVHSESYPLMQIGTVTNSEESEKLLHGLPKTFTEMMLALTLNGFVFLHNPTRAIIDNDRELLDILEYWEKTKGKDLAKLTEGKSTN